MSKCKKQRLKNLSFFGLIGTVSILGGCAKKSLQMPDDSYFLCSADGRYEAGVAILNADGEACLALENACVTYCVDADGKILVQKSGVIASDTTLFINIDRSPEDELLDTGIWDVDEEKWIIEPQNGVALPSTKDDILVSFLIGDQNFDANYMPLEGYSEAVFEFADGLVLKNKLDRNGRNYICDQYENEYMRYGAFYQANKDSGLTFPNAQEITIEDSILGKYMVIGVNVRENRPDGTTWGAIRKYLCDMNGKILCPELNYETVFFAEDQYSNTSRKYLQFYMDENTPAQFFDLENEKLVVFPEGYSDIDYAAQDYFLLSDGTTYQIFDAQKQELGLQIIEEHPGNIYVLGQESYVVQNFIDNKVVIEGKEHNVDDYLPSVGENVYPIIAIGKLFGTPVKSYILNYEGELVLETKEYVCYADEFQYLVLTDKMEYLICYY